MYIHDGTAGLAVSYLPGVPDYRLDPHVILPLVLPPLLYTAATESSYLDLRAQLRPVVLLSVGYVLFATFAVGWALEGEQVSGHMADHVDHQHDPRHRHDDLAADRRAIEAPDPSHRQTDRPA